MGENKMLKILFILTAVLCDLPGFINQPRASCDDCAQQYMNCISSCGSSDVDCNIACSRAHSECEKYCCDSDCSILVLNNWSSQNVPVLLKYDGYSNFDEF